MALAIIGGLVSNIRLHAEMSVDFLYLEAAMSLYETLDLVLRTIQLIIDIVQHLLRRWKKGKRIKK